MFESKGDFLIYARETGQNKVEGRHLQDTVCFRRRIPATFSRLKGWQGLGFNIHDHALKECPHFVPPKEDSITSMQY